MKIIIINPNQYGHDVGYLYYVKYLSQGHLVDYICFDSHRERIPFEGRNIWYLRKPLNHIARLRRIFKIGKYIKNGKYDIALFRNMKYAFIIKILGCTKSVYDIRTVSLDDSPTKRSINNHINKLNSYFFDKVFSISTHIIDYLKIQHSDISIIPLGGHRYFKRNEKHIKHLKFIYIGTLNKRRIYDTMNGFIIFCKNNPSIEVIYTIVGSGVDLEITKLHSSLINTPDNLKINLEGYIPNIKLGKYLQRHFIGISYVPLDSYFQPQPVTKTYEYLLAGMVVVATNLPSNQEVINSFNGVLIQDNPEAFAEGITYIHNNLNIYNPEQIQKDSSQFDWENIIENRLLRSLL
jgi:Glycosyl transferases group 1